MEEIMKTKEELTTVQHMNEEHPTEQEVEQCATIKAKVKEAVDQVKIEYNEFKMKLNAPVISS